MDNNQVASDYYVDIVMCIDGTASMRPIIDEVKRNALSFYHKFIEAMADADKSVDGVRIKVIVFRDFKDDEKPMEVSEFFTIPDQEAEFNAYVQGIEAVGGGDLPENAREAISRAMKSDWTLQGKKHRHVIIVFTDAEALPLGERASCPNYPEGMPADLAQLGAWWESTDQTFSSTYEKRSGRLVVFAPNAYPWSDIQAWNRYWPAFSQAGTGLKDLDINNVIDLLVGSID